MKWVFSAVFALLAAVAVFFFCVSRKLISDLTYSVDFGSVLDAVVLLILGIFIEFAYLKQSSDKQADTDLLLALTAEAKLALAELQRMTLVFESRTKLTKAEQISLTGAVRELSNALHSVELGFRHCDIRPSKIEFEKVKEAFFGLNGALTDTPFPGPYGYSDLKNIRSASRTMRDELTRMAFAINHR